MKKNLYIPPELSEIHLRMESALCISGGGEGMDPWEDGGASFAPSEPFNLFDSITFDSIF